MTRIDTLLGAGPTLSYEFYPPPSDEAREALGRTILELADTGPSFVSVTYGAGGSTRDRTRRIVLDVAATQPFPAMPHLTCVGNTRVAVGALLDDYAAHGIDNVLAVAGDPPADGSDPDGDFSYAIELVEMVHDHPHGFAVGVAAHPEVHPRSTDRASDRRHLAEKMQIADFAITQFFFDAREYFRLLDELAELEVSTPVIPGVFPVTAPKTARRFSETNGTTVPDEFFAQLEAADEGERLGLAVDSATELCVQLLDAGAPGVHIYTMNRSAAAALIAGNLTQFR